MITTEICTRWDNDGALSRGYDVSARTTCLTHKVDNERLIPFLVFAWDLEYIEPLAGRTLTSSEVVKNSRLSSSPILK